MGLFDFIKDIGFGNKDAKEDKLEAEILSTVQKSSLNLKDFTLKLDKGLATIGGTAGSIKDSELARLIVGNHRGVEKVNDDALKVVPATPTPLINPQGASVTASAPAAQPATANTIAQPAKMVAVKKGDTLSKIAKEQLGNANRYPEIFEANRPMLKDPDEIFPGQILRIPAENHAVAH
ncbi:MAG: LysM peptidoglycan-binding domain-containing protein [Proteobacteria bacterium]|nr:MAG: LysM peptidoglycan-binding domain-containing protein [Pseudomonadota bacterium]